MADISTEALQITKTALTTFWSDIEGMSLRVSNNSDDVLSECKDNIGQVKSELNQVESGIAVLNKQISELEEKILQATNEYNILCLKIPQIQSNILSLNSRIALLKSQIATLRSQLADTEDDHERQQIQEQINTCMQEVSQCEAERSQLENELRHLEIKKTELHQTICSLKSQKVQSENELSVQKTRCNKIKNKLERLNKAYSIIESDLKTYVTAAKKIESNSLDKAQGNVSAIEKCRASIEEYLSTSL